MEPGLDADTDNMLLMLICARSCLAQASCQLVTGGNPSWEVNFAGFIEHLLALTAKDTTVPRELGAL